MPRKKKIETPEVEEREENSYPSLVSVIDRLEELRATAPTTERRGVLHKWQTTLEALEREMRQLERIDALSSALKSVKNREVS